MKKGYKLKTHKGSAKRFKFTKNGKIKRNSAFRSHFLVRRSTKRKRQLRGEVYVHSTNVPALKKLMPYD